MSDTTTAELEKRLACAINCGSINVPLLQDCLAKIEELERESVNIRAVNAGHREHIQALRDGRACRAHGRVCSSDCADSHRETVIDKLKAELNKAHCCLRQEEEIRRRKDTELAERAAEIKRLRTERLVLTIENLRHENDKLKAEVRSLDEENERMAADISAKAALLAEKEVEIGRLNKRIAILHALLQDCHAVIDPEVEGDLVRRINQEFDKSCPADCDRWNAEIDAALAEQREMVYRALDTCREQSSVLTIDSIKRSLRAALEPELKREGR